MPHSRKPESKQRRDDAKRHRAELHRVSCGDRGGDGAALATAPGEMHRNGVGGADRDARAAMLPRFLLPEPRALAATIKLSGIAPSVVLNPDIVKRKESCKQGAQESGADIVA